MNTEKKIPPRHVPDRDCKYMGLAWFYASFSKDPNTQVGAIIVGENNRPLGFGYNGPPRPINDESFSWERPKNPDDFSKYDLIVHAEINAIDHSCYQDWALKEATLYVTAMPCPRCMQDIIRKEFARVVYMDLPRKDPASTMNNAKWRERSLHIAKLANLEMDKFEGNLSWMPDWMLQLKELGVF